MSFEDLRGQAPQPADAPLQDGPELTGRSPDRWVIARHLWTSSGLLPLWGLLVVGVALVTGIVSRFVEIEQSAWIIAVNLPPWYMFGMGVYMTAVYLPLYIAHGITRREFMRQATPFMVALAGLGAALMTAGFGIERGLYRLLDWPQVFPDDHDGLFNSPNQYGMIFLAFWLMFLAFVVVGAFIAAAFYRGGWGGLVGCALVPVGLVLVAPAELVIRRNAPVPLLAVFDVGTTTLVAVGACLTSFLVGLMLTWAFVRDLPLRSKA